MARGKDAAQIPSFAIVKFHLPGKDNQFDVAPLKWIQKTGNRTTIYWPSDEDASTSKVLLNLISKEAIVDKESWMLYNISVIAKFDTYAEAQKKLASAIAGEVVVSTDLENRGKGGRNKAKKRTAAAATASSTSPDPSTSSKKRTRKDAGNEKEESRSYQMREKMTSVYKKNMWILMTCLQVMMRTPVKFLFPKQYLLCLCQQPQLPSVPIELVQKQVSSEIPHRQSTTVSIPPATAGPSGSVAEVRGLNLGTDLIPRVFARKSAAPDYGLDRMENERTATTHKDSSSMQVGVYNQRLTTISTYAPDFKKIDFLIEQNKKILRGQEQIKAQNLDIKNTLAVVMDNTVPADPQIEGIKEEFLYTT
uniref:Uncharacterized protein n=1 Tax=Daphnia galeata TaxID=27404 RepID=A0A8J2W3P5_9CRUS|nr:unnamed protein product [Daphnia galeata]